MVVAAQPELQSCTALAVWSDVYADLLNNDRDTLATASMTPETFQIRAQCRHKAIRRVLQLSKLPVSRGKSAVPWACPGRDSNPDWDDFKSSASANWATGAGDRARRSAAR